MKKKSALTIYIDKKNPGKIKAPKHDACLMVISGNEENKKFNLYIQELHEKVINKYDIDSQIFKDPNNIHLDDNLISPNHAKIIRKNSRFYIKDNNSTSGTYVNGKRISNINEVLLNNGDIITLGTTQLKFLQGDIETLFLDNIKEKINKDKLTNTYNKHFFTEHLQKTFSLSKRYKKNFSLILFDIDDFKGINDTHGHPAGDYILSEIGNMISNNIRTTDIFARVGGEEFAIVCPEINLDSACVMGEKIRNLIQSYSFHFDDTLIPVTISVGICTYTDDIQNDCELYEKCDQKLYEAKRTGKNRVCY